MILLNIIFIFGIILKGAVGDVSNCPSRIPRSQYLFTYQNTCLQIVTSSVQWTNARKDCQSRGGDLVQIKSSAKQNFIMSTLRHVFPKKIWIGATDQDREGKWNWVTGDALRGQYQNWKSGQGPGQKGFFFANGMFEDCALLDFGDSGKWNDYMCSSFLHRFPYICQYNQVANAQPVHSSIKPTRRVPSFKVQSRPLTTVTKHRTKRMTSSKVRRTSVAKRTTRRMTTRSSTTKRTTKSISLSSKGQVTTRVFQSTQRKSTKTIISTKQQKPISKGQTTKQQTRHTGKVTTSKLLTAENTKFPTTNAAVMTTYIRYNTSRKINNSSTTHRPIRHSTKSNVVRTTNKNGQGHTLPQSVPRGTRDSNSHTKTKGWSIGVIVGCVALVGVVALVVVLMIRRRRASGHAIGIDNPVYGVSSPNTDADTRY